MKRTKDYEIWRSMIRRCTDPRHQVFERYGGRGIKVCDRWLTFENFHADMGPRPADRSLDRIDNNGHYEPSNCRWATKLEQDNNRRSNRLFTVSGETKTIAQWARHSGVKIGRLYDRVLTMGWSMERALSEPAGKARGERSSRSKLTADRVIALRKDRDAGMSLPALGRKYGITAQSAWHICRRNSWAHIP